MSFDNYGSSKPKPEDNQTEAKYNNIDKFKDYPSSAAAQKSQSDKPNTHLASTGQHPKADEAPIGVIEEQVNLDEADTLDALLDELDQLIGLARVKTEVRRLLQYVRIQELRRSQGITSSKMSLHSVFYGSPGTGKTTVARLYGRMLKALELLPSGHLVETDRSGLVANYIGQTANKTDAKVQEALGGVLFIDEAYSLSRGEHAELDYGSETIEILMKRMEDHRENFVLIVAGYPNPMNKFLRSNEGFRSRFSTFIHFDDFTPGEMLDIFKLFCRHEHYELANEAEELAIATIKYQYTNRDNTFGNARFVRNLFETIIRNHAYRVGLTKESPTISDLRLIEPEDIPLITDQDAI